MTNLKQQILDRVRSRLGESKLEESIIYLDDDLKHAAERVSVGDVVIDVPWKSYIVFVDFEPKANWGHMCSYIAIRPDGDEIVEFSAHMPPFLKADAPSFHLLWRGPLVPEWAVADNSR